jgi:hypothetical protein
MLITLARASSCPLDLLHSRHLPLSCCVPSHSSQKLETFKSVFQALQLLIFATVSAY